METLRFLIGHGVTSNNQPVRNAGSSRFHVGDNNPNNVQISYSLFWMFSLLHGHEDVVIRENVQFLRIQYDEDDTRTPEDFCYEKVVAALRISSPEEAVSIRFWRAVYFCGLTSFSDTNILPPIATLLTSYDASHLDGKTQLQLLATAYGHVLAHWLRHDRQLLNEHKRGLEEFILKAIALGLDVHEGFHDYTPLKVMLSSFCCFWDQGDMVPQSQLQKALIAWLRLFERAGVKVFEYGKKELCSFELHQLSQTPGSIFMDWYHDDLSDSLRWTGPGTMLPLALTCGHRSSDWHIVLLGFAEECLQDFWRLVEVQIREASYHKYVPPGGWIEC